MKTLFILTLLISNIVSNMINGAYALELRKGDILLQPLNCWVCNLIEGQEKTIYSHMGIVVETDPVMVGEAWGEVHEIPLNEFLAKTQEDQQVEVKRHLRFSQVFRTLDFSSYQGLPYDGAFAWDDQGLYCSELVYKLLLNYTSELPRPKPMRFDYARKYWIQYFNGNVPDGELGISPGDFERSIYFSTIGFL